MHDPTLYKQKGNRRQAERPNMKAKMTNIDSTTFTEKVLNNDKPVLVDFWAPWCGPCKQIKPHVDKIGNDYAGRADVVLVNTDENPDLATKYGVSGLPSLLVFKNGEVINRTAGSVTPPQIRSLMDAAFA